MKVSSEEIMRRYMQDYLFIEDIQFSIYRALDILVRAFDRGGKLLVCGNGGSNADADHIVGELVKGFKKKRPLADAHIRKINEVRNEAERVSGRLQQGLPAINLGAQTSLITATMNDIDGEAIFAQQVLAYGVEGDVLFGISTSGNSGNILLAMAVARQKGMNIIGLTGKNGGSFLRYADCNIQVPSSETATIQEMHTPVYHLICEIIENEFWDS